ncbi:MAG: ABC transporter ATP-binding protein [Alphaproteobacteria bacterium]
MNKVVFKNVAKKFGDLVVLKDFDLSIKKGESIVIIGGSGTGKSVSLKCLLGLLTPDSGSITVDGKETVGISDSERKDVNKNIGMLFQNGALFDSMTVLENISFGLKSGQGMNDEDAHPIAYDCLDKVGLDKSVAEKYPSDLSGGMRKRVALARAIAIKPEIILFDEPTTGLDPITASTIDQLIIDTVRKMGATAIVITHDMASVRRVADRVALLYQGEIAWLGKVKEMDTTKNPYVKQFISGSSEGPIAWAKTNKK